VAKLIGYGLTVGTQSWVHHLEASLYVLEAKTVKDAVDDQVEPLDAWPPTGRGAGVKDDRA